MKGISVLIIEVISCLFLFLLILFLLNYLNILSLSTIYPKQFGSLPQLTAPNKQNTNTNIKPVITNDKQLTAVGELKQAAANSISIISPSNKDKLIEYTVDKNTTFEQTIAFNAQSTKIIGFEEFKQTMITDKNHTIKIYYLRDNLVNLAGRVLFTN